MSYAYYPAVADKPTLVLLHGFISSRKYWKRLEPILVERGYGVIAIDLLGFGEARRLKTHAYTYESQTLHIKTCLESAGINSNTILIGHSMGALIAAYYAKEYGDDIQKFIMLHPPFYLSASQALTELLATGSGYRFLIQSRLRAFGWGILKTLPNNISLHKGIAREDSLEHIILADDNATLLTNPNVPALLVMGSMDRAIYLENHHATRNPGKLLTTEVIASDHHSPRKHPVLVADIIEKFTNKK